MTVIPIRAVAPTIALTNNSSTIRNERGESLQITRHCGNAWPEQQYTLEVHVMHDKVYPFLSKSGVAVDYAMSRVEVIALICKLADAAGMACELREVRR